MARAGEVQRSRRRCSSSFFLPASRGPGPGPGPVASNPIHSRPLASASTRCSFYNGWADLAADPGLPFAFTLGLPQPHGPFLLLPSPLPRSPSTAPLPSRSSPLPSPPASPPPGTSPLPHPPPSPTTSASLPSSPISTSPTFSPSRPIPSSGAAVDDARGLLLEAVDHARDGVLEYAATVAGQGSTTTSVPSDDGALGDVAREVASYFGFWARETLRELSFASPRKKPKEIIKVAPASVVDAKSDSDAEVVDKDAQAQQGDKHSDSSSIQASTGHASIAEGKALGSVVTESVRPLDILPFNGKDSGGLEDTGLSAQSTQEDNRLERLVFKHRHGRGSGVQNDDPFEGGRFATESTESSLLERTLKI